VAAGLALLVGIVAVVALGSGSSDSGSSKKKPLGRLVSGRLAAVPTNHVTGAGNASLRIRRNVATVTIRTNGLLNHAPHAMHIHAGAAGQCPPSSAAGVHNGHRAISTKDGGPYYGHPRVSLTTSGASGPGSILAFSRYPGVGNIRYTRRIKLSPAAARYIRRNNAVVVIHGIDYNENGLYDGVLDRSELNPDVQGETTAPGLCGPIRGGRSTASAPGGEVFTASLTPSAVAPAAPIRLLCHLSRPAS
jgi:hypothetical protein